MTYPSGERVRFTTGQPPEDLKSVMVCQASDPETSQVGVKCVKISKHACLSLLRSVCAYLVVLLVVHLKLSPVLVNSIILLTYIQLMFVTL